MSMTMIHVKPKSAEEINGDSVGIKEEHPTISTTRVGLKRELTLFDTVSTMTGVVIGSGIFVSPVSFVKHAGSVGLSLVFWVLCGIITFVITMCYAELGAMFPKAGGEYYFYKRLLGNFPAFVYAWTNLIAFLSVLSAIMALTASEYLLYSFFPDCSSPSATVALCGSFLVVFITLVNGLYVKIVARFQAVCTMAKFVSLAAIIIGGFVQMAKGNTEILASGFENTKTDPSSWAIAIYAGTFAFSGWNHVLGIMEEVKNPEKVIPRACALSIIIVTVVYLLTNIAYFTVLTPAQVMASPVVAMAFAEKTFGPAAMIVPILVFISCIGAMNGILFGGSRVSFAAARDGLFPRMFSHLHINYNTPWPSLIIVGIVTCAYVCSGSTLILVEYSGFLCLLVMFACLCCLLYVRYKEPHLHRPIKIHIAIVVMSWLSVLSLLLMGLYNNPVQFGIGIIIVMTSFPVYLLGIVWEPKPRGFQKLIDKLTIVVQKTLLVCPGEEEY